MPEYSFTTEKFSNSTITGLPNTVKAPRTASSASQTPPIGGRFSKPHDFLSSLLKPVIYVLHVEGHKHHDPEDLWCSPCISPCQYKAHYPAGWKIINISWAHHLPPEKLPTGSPQGGTAEEQMFWSSFIYLAKSAYLKKCFTHCKLVVFEITVSRK